MDQDRQLVVKSNHIIEASYRLSVAEQRVILSAISQVRRDKPVTDEVLYSVTAAELAQLCGTDPKTAYRDLQNAAERLQTRRVSLLLEPDGVTIRSKRRRVTCWVQTVDYIDQEGRIEMRFGKDILPYLTGLQREFTRYALSDVAKMTSAYGIRLYELLVQWPEGHREVALDDLRRWLQLEERYPSIKDLKRRVLDPAVEQINEHSPLMLSWGQRKTGRRVTHLVFDYALKKPPKTASGVTDAAKKKRKSGKLTDADITRLARPGETWETARSRLNQIPLEI
ncbi:replication initiation protein [Pseudomonas sp. MF6768]|uniref:replication initiation protein n=1 Tax=Pseudomonas sp. MF6768 TaxID=2797532 RepID=UPI0018E8D0A7|nr:replication initiation protein [Pseudomonas sp. MF6768]MBJ2243992.1 replication initiation protein [Pseudomonas sp. MF6768]